MIAGPRRLAWLYWLLRPAWELCMFSPSLRKGSCRLQAVAVAEVARTINAVFLQLSSCLRLVA
jgi:hypothetical protein